MIAQSGSEITAPLEKLADAVRQLWMFVGDNVGFFVSLLILVFVIKVTCNGLRGIINLMVFVLVILLVMNWLCPDVVAVVIGSDFQANLNVISLWIRDLVAKITLQLN